MFRTLSHTVMPVAAAALLAMAPGVVGAQSADAQQNQQGQMQNRMAGSKMDCQHMQAATKEMRSKRQEMQATLDELAAKVKATSGAKQQAAMAELLTTMVDQRRVMNDMMSTMQSAMMGRKMHTDQSNCMNRQTSSSAMSGGSMMQGSMMGGAESDQGSGKSTH